LLGDTFSFFVVPGVVLVRFFDIPSFSATLVSWSSLAGLTANHLFL